MIKTMLIVAVVGWVVALTLPYILKVVRNHKKGGSNDEVKKS